MKRYEKPYMAIVEVREIDFLLSMSEVVLGAIDIGSPNFDNDAKSIWDDEEDTHY